MDIKAFTRTCPVKIGDYFYRPRVNETWPDRIEVLEITDTGEDFLIRGKYIYHTIGTAFAEKTFSSKIFDDPKWVIEKHG